MTIPPAIETSPPPPARSVARRYHIEEIVLILVVVLSGIGVAISDSSPQTAFRYWQWVTPAFGIVSLIAAWSRATRRGDPVGRIVPVQALHWLGAIGAMYLIYVLQTAGRMENEAAGSAMLILLALAAFLAGVHDDWRMAVLGVVLGITAIGFALLEQFVWIIVLPALFIGIVALVIYIRRG